MGCEEIMTRKRVRWFWLLSMIIFICTMACLIHWQCTIYEENADDYDPATPDLITFYYIPGLVAFFLCGQGLMAFRVIRRPVANFHGLTHLLVLVILVLERIGQTRREDKVSEIFHQASDIACIVYLIQFFLAFNFLVLQYCMSEFYIGVHAFFGILTFIILCIAQIVRLEGLGMTQVSAADRIFTAYAWQHKMMSPLLMGYTANVLYIILMPQNQYIYRPPNC